MKIWTNCPIEKSLIIIRFDNEITLHSYLLFLTIHACEKFRSCFFLIITTNKYYRLGNSIQKLLYSGNINHFHELWIEIIVSFFVHQINRSIYRTIFLHVDCSIDKIEDKNMAFIYTKMYISEILCSSSLFCRDCVVCWSDQIQVRFSYKQVFRCVHRNWVGTSPNGSDNYSYDLFSACISVTNFI